MFSAISSCGGVGVLVADARRGHDNKNTRGPQQNHRHRHDHNHRIKKTTTTTTTTTVRGIRRDGAGKNRRFAALSTAAASSSSTSSSSPSSASVTRSGTARATGGGWLRPAGTGTGGLRSDVHARKVQVTAAASARSGGGDRVSVGDMKKALVAAGVDTSSFFERSDFEAHYTLLSDEQKAGTGGSSGDDSTHTSGSASSSSSSASDEKEKKKKTSSGAGGGYAFDGGKIVERIFSAIREGANRVEVKWGIGAKARAQTAGFRQTIKSLDSNLGVSQFFKTNVPPLWAKLQAFRATPAGRVVNFVFFAWLFASGIFWTLLSLGIAGVFLTNLLAPNFLRDRAAALQEQAQQRFREAQAAQMGGAAGPGGMGGMGGMGGNPYAGGMGGRDGMGGGMGGTGGTGGGKQQQRTSYGDRGGGGGAGATIDIDADITDA